MQTLTSIRRRGWSGQIASFPLFFLSFLVSFPSRKRVVPCGPNDVSVNFAGKTPQKTKILGVNRTFKSERQKFKSYNLKTT